MSDQPHAIALGLGARNALLSSPYILHVVAKTAYSISEIITMNYNQLIRGQVHKHMLYKKNSSLASDFSPLDSNG